jgi:hypothetical protein
MTTYANIKSARAAAKRANVIDPVFTTDADNRVTFSEKVIEKTRKVKPSQIVQNGVAMPREGTVGHKLWALADQVAATCEGSYKAIRLAVIRAAGDDFNAGNVRTEVSVWRKYHNIAKG